MTMAQAALMHRPMQRPTVRSDVIGQRPTITEFVSSPNHIKLMRRPMQNRHCNLHLQGYDLQEWHRLPSRWWRRRPIPVPAAAFASSVATEVFHAVLDAHRESTRISPFYFHQSH